MIIKQINKHPYKVVPKVETVHFLQAAAKVVIKL